MRDGRRQRLAAAAAEPISIYRLLGMSAWSINEHRIHFKLNLILCSSGFSPINLTGTDCFNRHDGSAFDNYATLLLAVDEADAGGGKKNKGLRMSVSTGFLQIFWILRVRP